MKRDRDDEIRQRFSKRDFVREFGRLDAEEDQGDGNEE